LELYSDKINLKKGTAVFCLSGTRSSPLESCFSPLSQSASAAGSDAEQACVCAAQPFFIPPAGISPRRLEFSGLEQRPHSLLVCLEFSSYQST